MNDVAERVARAIDADAWHEKLPEDGLGLYWFDRRNKARICARRVFEELRAHEIVIRFPDGGIAHELRGEPGEIWRALIDAALADASPDIGKEGIGNE